MDEAADYAVHDCERCPALVASRSRIVNGTGSMSADLVIVGEAPGAAEDDTGEPFVGRSGTLLTDTLRSHGLQRSDVRITNCVRCRPPENRNPHVEELENCRGYLAAEIAAIDPVLVLAVGKVPSSQLLGREVKVTAEAGQLHTGTIGNDSWPILVSLHPAAILYDRTQAERFEATIARAAAYVGATGTSGRQTDLGDFDHEERH